MIIHSMSRWLYFCKKIYNTVVFLTMSDGGGKKKLRDTRNKLKHDIKSMQEQLVKIGIDDSKFLLN